MLDTTKRMSLVVKKYRQAELKQAHPAFKGNLLRRQRRMAIVAYQEQYRQRGVHPYMVDGTLEKALRLIN